eukprot:TRINITY_DN1128_c0_g1_i3.p1 TRINITY_DN1128_c0_g1~~TRINITY_DN1128_c0_g1_i3.p1  ORF type:complete len:293 (-),score=81.11 TRINITY_DN1128_c0_g1_i3:481-1359(-)
MPIHDKQISSLECDYTTVPPATTCGGILDTCQGAQSPFYSSVSETSTEIYTPDPTPVRSTRRTTNNKETTRKSVADSPDSECEEEDKNSVTIGFKGRSVIVGYINKILDFCAGKLTHMRTGRDTAIANPKKLANMLKKAKKDRIKSQIQFRALQKQLKQDLSEEYLIEFMALVELFFGDLYDMEWIYDSSSHRSRSTDLYIEHNQVIKDVLCKPKGAYTQDLYEITLTRASEMRMDVLKDEMSGNIMIDEKLKNDIECILEGLENSQSTHYSSASQFQYGGDEQQRAFEETR